MSFNDDLAKLITDRLGEQDTNYYDTPAQPTTYKGVLCRSRLEARWAAFFDLLGIPWQHEPAGLCPGWLPDYHLNPGDHQDVLVEVKPFTRKEFSDAAVDVVSKYGYDGDVLIAGPSMTTIDGRDEWDDKCTCCSTPFVSVGRTNRCRDALLLRCSACHRYEISTLEATHGWGETMCTACDYERSRPVCPGRLRQLFNRALSISVFGHDVELTDETIRGSNQSRFKLHYLSRPQSLLWKRCHGVTSAGRQCLNCGWTFEDEFFCQQHDGLDPETAHESDAACKFREHEAKEEHWLAERIQASLTRTSDVSATPKRSLVEQFLAERKKK